MKELVGEDSKEAVQNVMGSIRGLMAKEDLTRAVIEIKNSIPNLEGGAIIASIAGSLQGAAELAPEVMAGLATALLTISEHLPYIGVCAGAIGAIAYTFKLSKDQDKNVETVSLWMASVKDWLMLVASKIDSSAAVSTLPLFKGLQDALVGICEQISSRERKWRVTKMLSSSTFERDFTLAKTAVLELKNALHDFLDQETQDRQEQQLSTISNAQVETNEKLASMDDQLTLIREMLVAQAIATEAANEADRNDATIVKEEEEQIYMNIQRSVGVVAGSTTAIILKEFILVFESFFYGGSDMPPEQSRGLRISIDPDNLNQISKAMWMKFYRKWIISNLNIEEYLNKIATEHPTMYTKGKVATLKAIEISKAKLAEKGIENINDVQSLAQHKAIEITSFGKDLIGKISIASIGIGIGTSSSSTTSLTTTGKE